MQLVKEPVCTGQILAYFVKKICHHFRDTSVHSDFFLTKFCPASSNFKGTVVLASEKNRILSGVKTIHIFNVKKAFSSVATIRKLKTWQRKFLLSQTNFFSLVHTGPYSSSLHFLLKLLSFIVPTITYFTTLCPLLFTPKIKIHVPYAIFHGYIP